MPRVTVNIPTPLRPLVDDRARVDVEADTVDEAVRRLSERSDELRDQLYADDGQLRNFVNVYLGDRDVRELDEEERKLSDGAELSIVPNIAGGAPDGAGPPVETAERDEEGSAPDAEAPAADAGPPLTWRRRITEAAVAAELSPQEVQRYSRHLMMPEVGMDGQKKLKSARVLLVGAGGLGSPLGLYLAAAGVGHLGLVDHDEVEFSNLQRQVLHDTHAVGTRKLESARRRIEGVNPEVDLETYETRLTSDNALEVMEGYDLVVDGSDNFPTRYLVNDASVLLGIPNVYGAIFRFDGQASVFGLPDGPCYRCLFRDPPPPELVPSCADAGVLGILPGMVGTVQAAEAVKLILGEGRSLSGRLLLVDALEMSFRELEVRKDPECPVCGEDPTVTELIDYEEFCGVSTARDEAEVPAIEATELERRLDEGEPMEILDVREPYEWEICNLEEYGAELIPQGELPEHLHELDQTKPLVVHCRSGARSARAVQLLRNAGFENAVNLDGGILAWAREIDPEMPEY